jgi:hypothetical protein
VLLLVVVSLVLVDSEGTDEVVDAAGEVFDDSLVVVVEVELLLMVVESLLVEVDPLLVVVESLLVVVDPSVVVGLGSLLVETADELGEGAEVTVETVVVVVVGLPPQDELIKPTSVCTCTGSGHEVKLYSLISWYTPPAHCIYTP